MPGTARIGSASAPPGSLPIAESAEHVGTRVLEEIGYKKPLEHLGTLSAEHLGTCSDVLGAARRCFLRICSERGADRCRTCSEPLGAPLNLSDTRLSLITGRASATSSTARIRSATSKCRLHIPHIYHSDITGLSQAAGSGCAAQLGAWCGGARAAPASALG